MKTIAFLSFLFVLGCLVGLGCKPAISAAELVTRKVQCALENRHLSDIDLLAKCAIDPRDARNVLDIVGKEREHDAQLMRIGCGQ